MERKDGNKLQSVPNTTWREMATAVGQVPENQKVYAKTPCSLFFLGGARKLSAEPVKPVGQSNIWPTTLLPRAVPTSAVSASLLSTQAH